MYTLAVQRDFVTQYFLSGDHRGAENQRHSHHYRVEVILEGAQLDRHGYLVERSDVEQSLAKVIAYYQDKTLNELPEFAGLNPSSEHFARIVCQTLVGAIKANHLSTITVKIWENNTWASYRQVLDFPQGKGMV